MRKVNPLGPQKIITMMLFLMSICIKVSAQSPYAMFGDNSKMLEAKREAVPSIYRVAVQSTNGESLYADFDLSKGIATLIDKDGNVIQQDSISENAKAMFTTIDPLCEKYYHLSPYSYCGGDPINRVDLHGDSITILDMASIDAIYNALQPGANLSIKFNNGVLIPESIRQIALNSPDAFLQDLYSIATNPQMVELATTSTNDYYIGNQFFSNPWSSPSDIDYAKEFNNGQESLLYPLGKTIIGNLGQTLYPISSDEYKRSTNNNVRININAMGNINQRSCGIAHEFGHVILFLKGQPHSHSNNADYIYGRQWNVMRRLGYDYLESPTGTVFR